MMMALIAFVWHATMPVQLVQASLHVSPATPLASELCPLHNVSAWLVTLILVLKHAKNVTMTVIRALRVAAVPVVPWPAIVQ
jgi:hypothetical protein